HPAALPLDSASVDLLVLPHTLEQTALPHDCLREAARVLMPEGRVVITGLQPLSWWGAQFSLSRRVRRMRGLALSEDDLAQDTPATHQMIGRWRLRDWLALLDFEVQWQRVGVFRPPWQNPAWQARLQGMEQWGARWAPWFGGAYVMVAVKRVVGMKRIRPAWRRASTRAQTARAVQRAPHP
ncbi:MAG: methyltransferase domain-containing protein, partial [Burkholderiaceae bacterium]